METRQAIRLVVSDLDGTLLDPLGEVSQRTRATVRALSARGIAFAIATSRRFTGSRPIAEALQMEGSLILYDGALIRRFPGGEILRVDALDRGVARQVVARLAAHGLRPIMQYSDDTYERLVVGPAIETAHEVNFLGRFSSQVTVAPLDQLAEQPEELLRVAVFAPLEQLRAATADLLPLACGVQLLARGNYGSAELSVFSPTASKGNALVALAASLEIPIEQTLAIGDGINDVSLLRAAGFAVAMANGEPETQAAADALTPSNAEDGAAHAIERYVLG